MERWLAKLLAALIILTCNTLAGILPVKVSGWFISKGKKGVHYLSLANCFGGGVFFGAYLMHMAPEVRLLMEEVYLSPRGIIYPLPELMTAVGFFLVLFMDTLVSLLVSKRNTVNKIETISCSVITDNPRMDTSSLGGVLDAELESVNGNATPVVDAIDNAIELKTPSKAGTPSNGHDLEEYEELLARPFIILVGLSFHFVLEGITLGFQETTGGVWVLVIAILSHELVISFTFGMRMVRLFSTKKVIAIIVVYSSAIPAGIAIGTIIFETSGGSEEIDIMTAFMLALSAGIFIYVTFLEILKEELTHDTPLSKVIAVTVGFLFMAVMVLAEQALANTTPDGSDVTTDAMQTTVS